MSFAGHVTSMIKRNNYNLALKNKHREHRQHIREMYSTNTKHHEFVNRRDIPPHEMEVIKNKIRAKLKKQQHVRIVKTTICCIIALIITYIVTMHLLKHLESVILS